MKITKLVISCEHASNAVPQEYQHLFAEDLNVLNTHRAYDLGAEKIAIELSKEFDCDYSQATVTRLLIDCNRSLSNPSCFSSFTRSLPKIEKQKLATQFYLPYRNKTKRLIHDHIAKGEQVLHLSIHSFTPEFKGVTRNAAIGLLYDPHREGEKEVARLIQELIKDQPDPSYNCRKNYPYRGSTDGFTRELRQNYSETNYLGFEIELNQILTTDRKASSILIKTLSNSLLELLQLL